ncbi:pilus (MSHA type) biogenesis protein MshL [Thaumasiovibrio sp. DFM-14]|uniref:pilus (MSHA type) biogenesis protein MshL n=1 Tax=Thaumasiovibrio sp. DFM-14 TaxID=3384792 RepID=UPI0039A0A02F
MRNTVMVCLCLILAGCSMGHQPPTDIQQALNQAALDAQIRHALPAAVSADLMPSGRRGMEMAPPRPDAQRFSVSAKQIDVRDFLGALVKDTEYSVVIHPEVSGQVSFNLQSVTLEDVFTVMTDIYGYEIHRRNNIIQVFPAGLRTETFRVDYLQLTRQGSSMTTVSTGSVSNDDRGNSLDSQASDGGYHNGSRGGASGGTQISTLSQSQFWSQLERSIAAIIGAGEGHSVVVSPQASLVTVKAPAAQLREVKQYLDMSHARLRRQVILEAKILEVTLNDGYQQGINWTNLSKSIGGTVIGIDRPNTGSATLPGLDAIGTVLGGQTNITIGDGNFEAVMRFMNTQGDLNVLSSPRLTAANNQKAVIKVGNDAYFVTNVSSDSSTETNRISSDLELTPFFSGISLDVTPQIDDDGGVLLHVHPAVIEVTEDIKHIDLGTSQGAITLPLASSSIRESDSIIHAHSGDVVVIGGLMRSSSSDSVSKVPLLGDIPGLGHLFRNVSKLHSKTELVILLRPTVVGADTWQQEIDRSRNLLDSWFAGS